MRRMVSRLMLAQIVDCAMSSFAAISCWVMPWPPSSTGRFMSWIFASSSRRSAGVSSGTLWRLPSVPTTGFGFAAAPFAFLTAFLTVPSLTPERGREGPVADRVVLEAEDEVGALLDGETDRVGGEPVLAHPVPADLSRGVSEGDPRASVVCLGRSGREGVSGFSRSRRAVPGCRRRAVRPVRG